MPVAVRFRPHRSLQEHYYLVVGVVLCNCVRVVYAFEYVQLFRMAAEYADASQ